jgi:hypothetical protein
MLAPYLIGVVAQTKGLAAGLATTVVYDVIALVGLFFLPETVKAGIRLYSMVEAKAKAKAAND